MNDNEKGLLPPYTPDELAAMPEPAYPVQPDGELQRPARALPEPPITAEALRAAGWECKSNSLVNTWYPGFLNERVLVSFFADGEFARTNKIDTTEPYVRFEVGGRYTILDHVCTMRDLSDLHRLLTGAPLQGSEA